MLTRYKSWADELVFSTVGKLPVEEITRQRASCFRNMIHTLNHVYVIDRVFQAHLLGQEHGYTARNTATYPSLEELLAAVRIINGWYIEFADSSTSATLGKTIQFELIGGGRGTMTCYEMIQHVVNHATYHRGYIDEMMYQGGTTPATTDLPVFLRDVPQTY